MKGNTSGSAQSQFQPYYKLHSRFLRFRKFRLVISSPRDVMFNSFMHCLHFVGRWQTVQIQIRRHITKVVLDQVLRCCSLEIWIKKEKLQKQHTKSGYELVQKIKMGNSIRHIWVNIKCENDQFSGHSFMKHYMYHFCYEYNMIYLFYVQMKIVCPSQVSVIQQYNNQSSGVKKSRDNRS